MEALNREFAWNRAEISFTVTIYTATTALLMPLVGRLLDQFGTRRVLLPAIICSAFALVLPVFMRQLWHFYLIIFLFSLAGSVTTSLPYVRIVSFWFDRRRGLFLGIVAAGIGLGFAIAPMVMQELLQAFGWRGAYLGVVTLLLTIVAPLIFVFIQDSPAEVGLSPDNVGETKLSTAALPAAGMTFKQAMTTSTFWLLVVMTFVFAFVFNGMAVHLVPMFKDHGMDPAKAVLFASIMGLALFGSRIIIGYLLDVVFAPLLAIITFLMGSVGLILAALNLSDASNLGAAILIGVGIGAETDVISYMTSRYFGLHSFGRIYGFFFAFFYVGTGLGPFALGVAYEMYGNYTSALYCYAALCVAITLTFVLFGPYKYHRQINPAQP